MKAAFVLLAIALPATYCFYLQPNYQHIPATMNTRNGPAYKSLVDLFQRLHHRGHNRCFNTFDESCINDGLDGAASDEDWLGGHGHGSNPGKRCVNLYDESCANGDIPGAGSDEGWLGGNSNPGRR